MDSKTVNRELLRLGGLLLALLLIFSLLRDTNLYQITAHETEGLNTLILLVGSIYAVILAFAIFVIWGQFTNVEDCVMRECSCLADMLRYSGYVAPEIGHALERAIGDYSQRVLKYEWDALGDGRRDKRAEDLFDELVAVVVEQDAAARSHAAKNPFHLRLIDMARRAGERRNDRVTKSLTRIPPTMFGFVNTIAAVLLLLVFVYPFHQAVVGMSCLSLVAVILFLANFVMRDMDNPLIGAWNVSPRPFAELKR